MTEQRFDPGSRRSAHEAQRTHDLKARADEVMRQSRDRWQRLQQVHTDMRAVSETVVSSRRVVSVTAVWGGSVTDVTFPTAAYKKLPAAELARVVQATVKEAQQKVTAAVAAILAPTLPPGVDATALMSGDVDVTTLLPARETALHYERAAGTSGTAQA